ncbi:MAG: hypothetical protein ABIF01_03465 [Candidatus Micrarchaeota archaeon]
MRFSSAILVLLICGIVVAEGSLNDSIRGTLAGELNYTDNYSVSFFWAEGENYGFVSNVPVKANATDNASKASELFAMNLTGGNVAIIKDNETIEWLLRARNRWLLTDLVEEVRGDIVLFNESRELEAKCKSSLGLDKAACWDVDSCLYRSCIYSQSMCIPFANGNGKPFLEAMAAFSKATVTLDLDTGEFMKALVAFAERKTETPPKESIVADMEVQVSSIIGNNLFKEYSPGNNGYEFCAPIPYRTDALAGAKAKITQIKTKLASDSLINTTRAKIYSETTKRIAALELAANRERTLLGDIKKNATIELEATSAIIKNASQIIVGETISRRLEYLNETVTRIISSENVSEARMEYFALVNESEATKAQMGGYISEFDALVKLSNDCSSLLTRAGMNVTSSEGKMKLEDLKNRKGASMCLWGPP